jgi:EmrB/QacA subfamily drug resistance transporter
VADTGDGLDHKHWVGPLLIVLIGVFMSILSSSIVNVAIASIMTVFNTDTSGVQWVSTAYMLAMAMIIPLSGWLSDKWGLKTVYLASMVVFLLGSLVCAMAWNLESLIVARVLQALGGGLMSPLVMAMIYRLVPRRQIGAGMGIMGMALLVAPAVGPTLGGWLVEYVNWRWIFLINLPIGILGLVLGYLAIPEFKKEPVGKLDVPGAITAAAGFAGLLFVLSKGNEWGWSSEATILTLVASIGVLVLFVLVEFWSPSPLLDIKVFAYPSFTYANITVGITTIGMFAALFYIPLFLQSIRGMGAMETGLIMFPAAIASALMMPVAGKLYDRFGPRIVVIVGLCAMAFVTGLLSTIDLDTSLVVLMWWLIWRGVAMGLCMMPAQTAALSDIPVVLVSRASSVTNLIRNVASSFGIAIMTVLMNDRSIYHRARLTEGLNSNNTTFTSWIAQTPAGSTLLTAHVTRQAYVMSIRDVFYLTAVLTLVAVVPAAFLKKPKKVTPTRG